MPWIDVATEVVLDPVVARTSFDVIRRQSWTNVHGFEQHRAATIKNVLGSVTPTGDNDMNREDGFQSQARTLLVVTRFLLRAVMEDIDGVQWQPDLIFFDDGHYIVRAVEGFGHFGNGFVGAICESFDYDITGTLPNPPTYGADDYKSGIYATLIGAMRPWA